MPTAQISQDKWEDYLSAFSAHNQSRGVNVDLESSELGPQRLANNRPLLGIEPDLKGEDAKSITVVVGDPQGGEPAALTHQVMNPRAIWIKEDDEGRAQALDIEAEEGRTIIQFT